MSFQGGFFHFAKAIMRCYFRRYKGPSAERIPTPAVFVCRHYNAKGPMLSLICLPVEVHTWVYHVFTRPDTCYHHCLDYTFTRRFRWKPWVARLMSALIARPFSALIRSSGAIPVYRSDPRIRETFRESVDALARGENLLVFPDVDYQSLAADEGGMYRGFLMLDELYRRRTGKHVAFVPLHISSSKRLVVAGTPLYIDGGSAAARERAISRLEQSIQDLSRRYDE